MPDIFDQLAAGEVPAAGSTPAPTKAGVDIFDALSAVSNGKAVPVPKGSTVTDYGQKSDKWKDSNSLAGIGGWDNELTPGESLAVSPDIEEAFQKLGIKQGQKLKLYVDGSDPVVVKWDDRTANDEQAKKLGLDPLRGRFDIFTPDAKENPLRGRTVLGFEALPEIINRPIKKKDGTGSRNTEPSIRATDAPFFNPDALSQDPGKTGDIFDQLAAAAHTTKSAAPDPQGGNHQPTSGALEDAARRVPAEISKVSAETAAGALHAADMAIRSPVSMPNGKGAFHPGHSEEYTRLLAELEDLRTEQAHNVEGASGPDPREGKILTRLAELEKDPNDKRPLQAAAEAVRDIGQRSKDPAEIMGVKIPGVDPARDNQVSSKVIAGASSLVPIIASGPLAPATTAAMMGEQQRDDAEEHGAGEDAQNKAFALGASVGALSEAVLGIPSIMRAAKAYKVPPETLKEFAKRAAVTALHSAPKEGGQEALEQLAQNIIAKDIIGYDPGRDRSEGVVESGIYGAMIGPIAGGTLQIATDIDDAIAKKKAEKAAASTDDGFADRIRIIRERTEGLAPAGGEEKFDDRTPDGKRPEVKKGDEFSEFPDGSGQKSGKNGQASADPGKEWTYQGGEWKKPESKAEEDPDALPDDELDPEVQKINETNQKLAEDENQAEADRLAGAKVRTDFDKELEALLPEEERAKLSDEEREEWDRMRAEHHAELLQETDTELKGTTYELLEALKKVGYLPAVSVNKEATGEMKRIWEAHPAARMKIFRKNQPKSLDTVREELEGYGFKFETAYDMLSAIENRVSSKREQFGTQYSKRAQANPKAQATPEEVENWWKRTFRAIGPGISRQVRLKLGDPETMIEEGAAAPDEIPEDAQAAWNAKLRTIYLLRRGNKTELADGDVLDLVHEAGHAWADTLGPKTRAELEKLFLAERRTKSGPAFKREGARAELPVDPRMGSDIGEWFAERVALDNYEWATKRAEAGANDGSLIGRAAAGMRLAWVRFGEAVGGNKGADVITRQMREFLNRGHAAFEASGGVDAGAAYTYAGTNSSGYDDEEEKEGQTFPGRSDGLDRFEVDETESAGGEDDLQELYAGPDVKLGDLRTGENLQFSRRGAELPKWNSPLEQAITAKMPNRAPVSQVRGIIDPKKGSGVKAEEIEWSGLEDFLEGKTTVTKDEVLDYLRANSVKIEPIVKGSVEEIDRATDLIYEAGYELVDDIRGYWMEDSEGRRVDPETLPAPLRDAFNTINALENNETKYHDWRLAGGKDYREEILTLPRPQPTIEPYGDRGDQFVAIDPDGNKIAGPSSLVAIERYVAQIYNGKSNPNDYRSSHWEEANPIVHVRRADFHDNTDASVRVIEEIQSDWHQAGRRRGYGKPPANKTELVKAAKAFLIEKGISSNPDEDFGYADETDYLELADSHGFASSGKVNPVPDAPFKATEAWSLLGFKHALAGAVRDGISKLAIITGDIAADRFSLTNHVDKLNVGPSADPHVGKYWVEGYKDGKNVVAEFVDSDEKLVEALGKEMAEKAIAAGAGERIIHYQGEELKVGGHGMRKFYNEHLPSYIRKYVKKWGAKLETVKIPGNNIQITEDMIEERPNVSGYGSHFVTYNGYGDRIGSAYDTRQDAEKSLRNALGARADLELPAVVINPEMRAAVEKGQPLFSKRKTLTPAEEEALRKSIGDPPGAHVEFGPGRLYLGTADIFERTKGLEFLGKAIRRHVDRARMYIGKVTAPFRAWELKYGAAARKKAYDEFERYQIANEKNRKAADNIRHLASPAGKELLDLWDKMAARIQQRNELRGLMVKGERGWRKIHKVTRYFPRSLRPEIRRMLNAPKKNRQHWEDLVVELVDAGLVKNEKEAEDYVKAHISTDSRFDYLANVEQARRIPLPTKMYDYTFAAAQRYLVSWAERMAQIEAYGQKTTADSQDLWDHALLAAGTDRRTKEYIQAARDRAFNVTRNTWVSDSMNVLNAIATGTMLGNPVTVGANVASGIGMNFAQFGTRHAMKGLLEIANIAHEIDDAFEKGILQEDLLSMARDSENTESKAVNLANASASFLLKWSGYNISEQFVRGHSLVTAKSFLREALKAHSKNPSGSAWKQYARFFERNNVDPAKLAAEKGAGLETDRFFRNAINNSQGGYRFDQVPIYVDTPVGRFLFKFQKYGTQAARYFALHVMKPLLAPGKGNPREIRNALRYAVILAVVGAGVAEWRRLFGQPNSTATLNEIARTMKEDDRRGLALLAGKVWNYWIAAGAGGMFGNYAQLTQDTLERSKFKNPLNPPGISTATNAGELLLRLWEQGKLTSRDLNDAFRAQLSIWRTLQSGAANVAEVVGSREPWAVRENARQDAAWLRTITRRFADESGSRPNRTSLGRVGKTPDSPTLANLKDALISGDVKGAKEAIKEYVESRKNEAAREMALTSLKSTVRSSQPVKIGTSASDATKSLFLKWARKRLEAEDVARIQKIDRTYRDTAAAVGLMAESKPASDKAMEAAENRLRSR